MLRWAGWWLGVGGELRSPLTKIKDGHDQYTAFLPVCPVNFAGMQPGSTLKSHWETLYANKEEREYSWFQFYPNTSIDLIQTTQLPKNAAIIDIGGGDSRLADALLDLGYTNITVLDISEKAIGKAKKRLGAKSTQITWICSDINDFEPAAGQYDCWHDRAAFHFLTAASQVERYAQIAARAVRPGGFLLLGTFAPDGPEKCSGLPICRYSRSAIAACFSPFFQCLSCKTDEHRTPSNTKQSFLFCSFQRENVL